MPKKKRKVSTASKEAVSESPQTLEVTFRASQGSAALQKYRAKLLLKAGSPHQLQKDQTLDLGPFILRRSREHRATSAGGSSSAPPPGWDPKCWQDLQAMSGGAGAFNPLAAASLPPAVPQDLHEAFGCLVAAVGDETLAGAEVMQLVRSALKERMSEQHAGESAFLEDALQEVEDALRQALAHRRRSEPLTEQHRAVHEIAAVLSLAECTAAVALAEKHAARTGGWTTARHREYPTTDVCTFDIPDLHQQLKSSVVAKVLPVMAEKFSLELKRLDISDMFIAKYVAPEGKARKRKGALLKRPAGNVQSGLEEHEDGTPFSFVLGLNALQEFDGGGTRFVKLESSPTFRLPPGDVLIFSGYNRHCGVPITRGVRYILAGFVAYDELG